MNNKIVFKTAYTGHERKHTEAGRRMQDVYGYEIDAYGRKILVKTGETDLYAKIQGSLEETKIENILARCVAGDTSMLRPDGIYVDCSEVPTNMVEQMKAIQNLENTWNGLSNDIKKKYNYDVGQFIGQSGTEEWLRDMGLLEGKAEIVAESIEKEKIPEPAKVEGMGVVSNE